MYNHDINNWQVLVAKNEDLTFSNFVLTSSNKSIALACENFAIEQQPFPNPLLLYGRPSVGKTHLLQAITYSVRSSGTQKVHHTTFEIWWEEYVNAIRADKQEEFLAKYRNINVLVIDDLPRLNDRLFTQSSFANFIVSFASSGQRIVCASPGPVSDIEWLREKLVIVESTLIVEMLPPTPEELFLILSRKSIGQKVPASTLKQICYCAKSDIRCAEGMLKRLLDLLQKSNEK